MKKVLKNKNLILIGSFVLLKLVLHFATNYRYGFQRDEFLYLALGRHLDWGFMSVPPFTPFVGWWSQHLLGDSLFATRFFPALAGATILALTGLMAKEMGGGRFGVFLACLAILVSPAYLISSTMLQPVIFDILFWTFLAFWIIKFINTQNNTYLLLLGLTAGIGLLNKYSVLFFILGIFVGMLLTPNRTIFTKKYFYYALGLTTLLVLPNIIWQIQHNFPVLTHMSELASSQFVHVEPLNFIIGQFMMNVPGLLVWLAGLYFLFTPSGKPYRIIGWIYWTVLLLFLLMSGKSYYTLGAYPMLLAAGAVQWERWTQTAMTRWLRPTVVGVMIALISLALPLSLPILSLNQLVRYNTFLKEKIGLESPFRWEDGKIYALQQDHADMLGWEELANLMLKAYQQSGCQPGDCLLYCENYGQAGAVELFGKKWGLPPVYSFSDNYKFWMPDTLPNFETWLHVDDQLGDLPNLFESIEEFGKVENPYARENGATVYICRQLKPGARAWIEKKIKEIKGQFE